MGVKLEYFSCICAELQDYKIGGENNSRLYFYRAYNEQTIESMLVKGFFNDATVLRDNDLILLYEPKKDRGYVFAKVVSTINGIIEVKAIGLKAEYISVDNDELKLLTGNNLQEIIESSDKILQELKETKADKKTDFESQITEENKGITRKELDAHIVGTKQIKDNAITTPKLADEAVETEKIKDSAVETAKIANGAITAEKLAGQPTFAGNAGKTLVVNDTENGFVFKDISGLKTLTKAQMKADLLLKIGDFVFVPEYPQGLYKIETKDPTYSKDEDEVVLLDNGLMARKQQTQNPMVDDNNFDFNMGNAQQSGLVWCALSYYFNKEKFYYGNEYVGNNATNVVAQGLKDGKYQIDCSSFAQMVSQGIPFEKSVYNGQAENVVDDDWGYNWLGKENYYYGVGPNAQRMLANDMAYYLYERGYLRKAKSDFSNLQTGDIVFFSNRENAGIYWQEIGHVGIFLCEDRGTMYILEANDVTVPVEIKQRKIAETTDLIWFGRMPTTGSNTLATMNFATKDEMFEKLATYFNVVEPKGSREFFIKNTFVDDYLGQKTFRVNVQRSNASYGWFEFTSYEFGRNPNSSYKFFIPVASNDPLTKDILSARPIYRFFMDDTNSTSGIKMPDYANGTLVESLPFTAPTDGILIGTWFVSRDYGKLKISSAPEYNFRLGGTENSGDGFTILLSKGESVSNTGEGGLDTEAKTYFYPFKGV